MSDIKNKIRWRVLIFPGGTEVGMEIARSLQYCKEVLLFAATSEGPQHTPYVFSRCFTVPKVSEPAWWPTLTQVISENKIDFIFPANALVIDALIEKRSQLPKECQLILPGNEIVTVTRSKRRTYAALKNRISVPVIYDDHASIETFPVFVKPDSLYGEQRARRIESAVELEELLVREPDLLVQEFLPGSEYTIDCFSDRHGRVRFCAGRERLRVRMGTAMHSKLADVELQKHFENVARVIQQTIPLRGPWFFQMKADRVGTFKLLEVEARLAGTAALSRVRGINIPLLALYDRAGLDVQIMLNAGDVIIDRALVNRYRHSLVYRHVYVDLDDTLIVHNRVNTQLVAFLYQCRNRGVRLTLISKSLVSDKNAYLQKYKLESLFDSIIWLDEKASKADAIDPKDAIFIDDSFSARQSVAQRHNIPTFDPPMIEMLLDERV